jgi:hypothetical protein
VFFWDKESFFIFRTLRTKKIKKHFKKLWLVEKREFFLEEQWE